MYKTTKTKKQMFIFYVSLNLYKLFSDCQTENNGVFSDCCYFCKVFVCPRCVAGEQSVFCVLTKSYNVCYQRLYAVYRIFFFIPHLGYSVAPGQRVHGTLDCQHGLWPSVGPEADSVA